MATSGAGVKTTGANVRSIDVTATADADTSYTFAHGLGVTPDCVILQPLLQAPAGASLWATTTVDATNVVVTKSTAVGSGNAGAQLRVTAVRWHSVGA